MTMHASRTPTEADKLIGQRITYARKARGMTAQDLADALGISRTQLDKYEAGRNRIGAARLSDLATHLGLSVATLVGEAGTASGDSSITGGDLPPDALAFAINFTRIPAGKQRDQLATYVEELANSHRPEV